MYIGIRDINKYEQKIIDKYNMWTITPDEVNDDPQESYEVIKSFMK